MGKKRALEPDGQVDTGRIEPGKPGFENLLAEKVLEQLDLASLASKLAPELAARLAGTIQLDALSERVFEKLADRLANDPVVVEAVATQLSTLMDGKISGESPRF